MFSHRATEAGMAQVVNAAYIEGDTPVQSDQMSNGRDSQICV